ncbi:MAG: GNAT family N-acetyltransferase, partial [Cyanothece sp. SIO1E1]|nr:GNAT family N-acetyltransferase [Cyanothece sp. SIO1E1]
LAKIERMAVLAAHRRQGLGTKIMATALDFLSQQHIPTVKIHAQLAAKDFYQKLGFEQQGEVFEEAQILHVRMLKSI